MRGAVSLPDISAGPHHGTSFRKAAGAVAAPTPPLPVTGACPSAPTPPAPKAKAQAPRQPRSSSEAWGPVEPYVPLKERCAKSSNVFKRYGYLDTRRRPAEDVVREMRRPIDTCGGPMHAGPWHKSVARMRGAEAMRRGHVDSRPVPSWNFRYGSAGSYDGSCFSTPALPPLPRVHGGARDQPPDGGGQQQSTRRSSSDTDVDGRSRRRRPAPGNGAMNVDVAAADGDGCVCGESTQAPLVTSATMAAAAA
eukprot:gnl/TRDRNA2_/TRDRNA2_48754_c0_seq1.p1 gnl/TRDRNA2_/TRDRNA2_48754_c0~~gnl/TRDRNA2_/TRDRNA2_48754_c0_seq1.p1  ORF type:complete len:251 (+),score=27.22 gnl/TRDRNA2_/TRDRNA2_48754_c0_seq1:110-862(+)